MIGLGKWACNVNTMVFSGEVNFEIFDDNGKYGFNLNMPGVKIPDITVKEVVEDGDTINATVSTSMLDGKDLNLVVTLDGDTFDGYLKVPFFGKVKLKNGHRVA